MQIIHSKMLICFLRRRDKPPSKPTDILKNSQHNNTKWNKRIIQVSINRIPQPCIVKIRCTHWPWQLRKQCQKIKCFVSFFPFWPFFSPPNGSDVKQWHRLQFPQQWTHCNTFHNTSTSWLRSEHNVGMTIQQLQAPQLSGHSCYWEIITHIHERSF